jgi:ubiquitin fusion degradation protein 1
MPSGPRVITSETIDLDRQVPAALVLPEGKLFFGYKYIPFDAKAEEKRKKAKEDPSAPPAQTSFQGQGNSLHRGAVQPSSPAEADAPADGDEEKPDPWANLGSGQTLSGRKRGAPTSAAASAPPTPAPASAPVSAQPTRQEVIDATMLDEEDFMFDDDEYYDGEEDDIIEIDSD